MGGPPKGSASEDTETFVDTVVHMTDEEAADLDTLLEGKTPDEPLSGSEETRISEERAAPPPGPVTKVLAARPDEMMTPQSERPGPQTKVTSRPVPKAPIGESDESTALAPSAKHALPEPAPGASIEELDAQARVLAQTEEYQNFGRFRLMGRIGEGGMAEVRVAIEEIGDGRLRPCVVKYIRAGRDEDPELRAMFTEEGRVSQMLDHPSVVRCYGAGEIGGLPYIALELIDGLTLIEVERHAQPEKVPLTAAIEIMIRVSEALRYIHDLRGPDGEHLKLVHRDVSPDNILVARNGVVKLVDFGIARFAGRGLYTATGVVRGKLLYMSPEQIRAEALDARSDRFSLAVVVARLVLGRQCLPKEPTDILRMEETVGRVGRQAGLHPRLLKLLTSMLVTNADRRPGADEILESARSIYDEVYVEAETLEAFTQERIFSKMPPLIEASHEITHVSASLQRFLSQISKRSFDAVPDESSDGSRPRIEVESMETPRLGHMAGGHGSVLPATMEAPSVRPPARMSRAAMKQLVLIKVGLGVLAIVLLVLLMLQ